MKETKVYVDELPKSCIDCPCRDSEYNECNLLSERHHIGYYDGMGWRDVPVTEDFKEISCPLIDIKTHDRELVRQVCEKIRKTIASTVDLAESNQQIKDQFHIILDLVEKEYEK